MPKKIISAQTPPFVFSPSNKTAAPVFEKRAKAERRLEFMKGKRCYRN
ncbi:hypothetical protein HMPREF7215_1358 [Pyramidobacter piscolens W5455]|uniref:Uncharacterized protein n=1 Tax=Pyramidobacter piscolens W5455 TaxID=352165 RepID=A0ABM9ZYC6_9BACT|nr:hypothetical protein HMPREF7215_1358 [Pyramidobacter piscolens W5455]